VGRHQDGGALLGGDAAEQGDDRLTGGRIQIPGRLIGENQARGGHESAGNGDALHLTAGELMRMAVSQIGQADPGQPLQRDRPGAGPAGQKQRQLDVFDGGERGQKLERLEDEADLAAPQPGQLSVIQAPGRDTVDAHLARGGLIHGAGQVEQRGLAATAAADQRDELARADLKRDAPQRLDGDAVAPIAFPDAFELQQGHCASS